MAAETRELFIVRRRENRSYTNDTIHYNNYYVCGARVIFVSFLIFVSSKRLAADRGILAVRKKGRPSRVRRIRYIYATAPNNGLDHKYTYA